MPSSYSRNISLEKPATGEQAGSWGDTANKDYDILDNAIDGNLQIPLSASTYSLDAGKLGESSAEGRNKVIIWTGTLTAGATVTITPNTAQKLFIMTNATIGGFPISFSQGSGGSFSLNAGCSAIIYADGGGSTARVDGALYNPQFGSVVVNSNLSVAGNASFSQPASFTQPVTFTDVSITPSGMPSAQNDIYYRQASGNLASLPVGAPGQFLQVQAVAPSGTKLVWSSVAGLSIGTPVGSSAANCIFYANSQNQLSQDSGIYINPGTGIGIGILPSGHALQVGYAYPPSISIETSNPSTQQRDITFATSAVRRWQLLTPTEAEVGTTNVGSNLQLTAWNDQANASASVLYFKRDTGNVTVGGTGGDQGAKLSVVGTNVSQAVLRVRGTSAAQTGYLQVWENSAQTRVASIDNAGNLYLINDPYVRLINGRIQLGTIATPGSPQGSIHIGRDNGSGPQASIVMELAVSSPANIPAGAVAIYQRNSKFVIQFTQNGTTMYYLWAPLTPGASAPGGIGWTIDSAAV